MVSTPATKLTRRNLLVLAGAAALGEAGCRHEPAKGPSPMRVFGNMVLTMDWVEVPAGKFLYGDYKVPVTLPTFWILRNQVTVKQFRAYCLAIGRPMPREPKWGWRDDHPIVNVTWRDAAEFCRLASAVLPSEQQWEKAARGTDGRLYAWGNHFDPTICVCSVSPTKHNSTAPVGQIKSGASPFGVESTAGNVAEWCNDRWDAGHQWRVVRGGSYADTEPLTLRVTFRDRCDPDASYTSLGFRPARNTKPPVVNNELL